MGTNFENNNRIEHLDILSEKLAATLSKSTEDVKLIVIIPAKDESLGITETLTALKNQKCSEGQNYAFHNYEVLVLCHNCSDDTFEVCQKFSRKHPHFNLRPLVLNSEEATTVGAARRILMNIAYERLSGDNALIVSTDADTIPNDYWLFNLDRYLNTDIDLICGLIKVNHGGLKIQASNYLASKDAYLLLKAKLESIMMPDPKNPWPRHGYNWGPNLALKKNVYKSIGGIRPLHFLEDVDLYNRVYSAGFSIRHCMDSVVQTSVRIDSRCEEGFGAELKVWSDYEDVNYNVESLDKLICRYTLYNLCIDYYNTPSNMLVDALKKLSFIECHKIPEALADCDRPEAMVVKMQDLLNTNEKWHSNCPNINVDMACAELTKYFQAREKTIRSALLFPTA